MRKKRHVYRIAFPFPEMKELRTRPRLAYTHVHTYTHSVYGIHHLCPPPTWCQHLVMSRFRGPGVSGSIQGRSPLMATWGGVGGCVGGVSVGGVSVCGGRRLA
jgi:hypothetical protein